MSSYGISTWSIHRSLQAGAIDLLDVPQALRAHGLTDLQICHFHLASREPAYLDRLRARVEASEVMLDALLIDFGDISHPEQAAADVREIEGWLAVAAQLGARHARVSAGSQTPTPETLARSAAHLKHLSNVGDAHGVRVVTENWHDLVPTSREIETLGTMTDGRVPLCIDFGNWSGPTKYDELEAIAPLAVTAHAKCSFAAENTPDEADFRRCLAILDKADFDGTIALIYDGPSPDEWRHIDRELAIARAVI